MLDSDSAETAAYAGRWVALVRGRVVAQGETREEVLRAARNARAKESAEVRFMPYMPVSSPLLEAVRALLPAGEPVHLVGGAVRDAILQRGTHDLDFACPHGLTLAKKVADGLGAAYFPLEESFDAGRVIIQNQDGSRDILDFSGYRDESLDADLRGRDLTINAVAMDMHSGTIVDPLGGVQDIREKRLRACSEKSMSNDPIRVLRAVRQAAAFGFSIEAHTRAQMKSAASLLPTISPERLRDELIKILAGPKSDAAIRALDMLGVFQFVLPELTALKGVEQSAPHVHDVWTHTLAVLRHLENILDVLSPSFDEQKANADLMNGLLVLRLGRFREQINAHLEKPLNADRASRGLLFFAALYHDVEKPRTRTVENGGRVRFLGHDERGAATAVQRGSALHFSNDELQRLDLVIRHHMRVHGHSSRNEAGQAISRRAIYRFFRDTGEAGVDLILLALADTRATYDHTLTQQHWASTLDVCRELLEGWYEKAEQVIRPVPLLSGDDLIGEFKQKPGPEIGKILEAAREAQAAGVITTREEALAFVRGWLAKTRSVAREAFSTQKDSPLPTRKDG